jgi:Fe-S cluster assembly protein SufD
MKASVLYQPQLQLLRKNAKKFFVQNGVPTPEHEDWAYTNLAKFNEMKLTEKVQGSFLIEGIEDKKGISLVSLANPQAVSFIQKFITCKKTIKSLWQDSMEALNLLRLSSSWVLVVDSNFSSKDPIMITKLGGHCRLFVIVKKAAQATIFEKAQGPADLFLNNVTEVLVEEGAQLEWIQQLSLDESTKMLNRNRFFIYDRARLNFVFMGLGGEWLRQVVDAYLMGIDAKADFSQILIGSKHQHLEFYSQIEHLKGFNETQQLTKMVCSENAKCVFSGKVKILAGAQKAASAQLSKSLLLSKSAQVINKPQLEIEADDVKATHGATVGQLRDDEIFYLQSRGITKQLAEQLLSQGFVDEILLKINNSKARNLLSPLIHERFKR